MASLDIEWDRERLAAGMTEFSWDRAAVDVVAEFDNVLASGVACIR